MADFVGCLKEAVGDEIGKRHLVLLVYLVFRTDRGTQLLQVPASVDAVVELHAHKRRPFHVFLVILKLEATAYHLLVFACVGLGVGSGLPARMDGAIGLVVFGKLMVGACDGFFLLTGILIALTCRDA